MQLESCVLTTAAVADAVRTSLGPKGMDKMVSGMMWRPATKAESQITTGTGEVVITNDGATILKHMAVLHPAARMVCFATQQ